MWSLANPHPEGGVGLECCFLGLGMPETYVFGLPNGNVDTGIDKVTYFDAVDILDFSQIDANATVDATKSLHVPQIPY